MIAFKWLFAWFSGRLAATQNEDSKMPDDLIQSGVLATTQPTLQSLGADTSQVVADVANTQVAAKPSVAAAPAESDQEAPAPDVIEKLEGILEAIGHKLPAYWHEAVALAKKAV
ncbi:hypothetical protein NUH87_26740 [Pseudomonas batumici]|uniref:hypothetical protein n=1 Tax=Pseudomonas batumici TaxID=226910 RepID=UPI0030D32E88